MQTRRKRSLSKKTEDITECSPGTGKPLPSEHEEQCAFVSSFRKAFPGVRIIAVPNGGWRDIRTAARLKAEGVCRGVPDLFIPEWGLWIEMKRQKGGAVSDAQKDWLEYLDGIGYGAVVCCGAAEAMNAVLAWREAVKDGCLSIRLG
ncbi:hypothetical protein B5F39_10525 [Cloacibacillus sp. An23]|nr:hypothetical protein B5F39_10525 [Cloacibacillus sp. An23]